MQQVEDSSVKLIFLAREGKLSLYEYSPTFIKPLAIDFEKMKCVRRFRFWYELLKGGYKVYYLADGDTLVGHCVVTQGGRRLSVSSKDDIVLGPYFTVPEHRGKGYGKVIVRLTLQHCTYDYKCAYDWIHERNIASIKTSEACGFIREGRRLNVVGLMRKLVLNDNGDNIIYKYTR
ncbi:MAG: GNAT family N-acetyltransferase [Bacteroidaceae bacterium]